MLDVRCRGGSGVDAGWGRLRRPVSHRLVTASDEQTVWMLGGDACVAHCQATDDAAWSITSHGVGGDACVAHCQTINAIRTEHIA